MAVTLELTLNGSTATTRRYVSWAPSPATLRIADPGGAVDPLPVRLQARTVAGRLVFAAARNARAADELTLTLPIDGSPVPFWVLGRFGAPSRADRDATVRVLPATGSTPIATFPLMVRIRKDAETLTVAERGRFLSAFARLNNGGAGVFRAYRDMHTDATSNQAHGQDGFLPWHRAYLLDLERELQRIDPSVALPYWRFDRPSPKLFMPSYLGGVDPQTGAVRFAPTNPLTAFSTDGQIGVFRWPLFDPASTGARDAQGRAVSTEATTVNSAVPYGNLRSVFEGNPHGQAHVSFGGYISQIGSAARDPLFFLLHANVDRLWAKWQWFQKRFDASSAASYARQGRAPAGSSSIGHFALDTMWPWNNVRTAPRPRTAPRTPFPTSELVPAPGGAPTVAALLDFQGVLAETSRLGFDYDDVPFET